MIELIIFVLLMIFLIVVLLMIFLASLTRKQLTKSEREQQEQAKREQQDEPDKRSDEDILGLSRGWTQEDLKVAYRRKCNQLHPDKWEKMPKQMQLMMEKEFKAGSRYFCERFFRASC